jgi:hypothetical protein
MNGQQRAVGSHVQAVGIHGGRGGNGCVEGSLMNDLTSVCALHPREHALGEEELQVAVGEHRRRHVSAGGAQMFAERQSDVLGDLVAPNPPIAIAVERQHRLPEGFGVQFRVAAATLHRHGHVKQPITGDGHGDRLACKAADVPFLSPCGRFVALHPPVAPEYLYHGTPGRSVESIRATGLNKGQRHHVHLSPDTATASKVGQRRRRPVVLRIQAREKHGAGHVFYRSANGVWLVDHVPPQFIEFPV